MQIQLSEQMALLARSQGTLGGFGADLLQWHMHRSLAHSQSTIVFVNVKVERP